MRRIWIALLVPLTALAIAGPVAEAKVVRGTNKSDDLKGTKGKDRLKGLGGNDDLAGRAGNDRMAGGPGKDELKGQAGNDILRAGPGKDRLDGSGGGDTLVAEGGGRDRIRCGGGQDEVRADQRDRIVDPENCESEDGGGGPGPGPGDPGTRSGRVVFRSGDEIFRVPATGGTPENLTVALDTFVGGPSGQDQYVNISPDGAFLVIQSPRFGCQANPCMAVVEQSLQDGQAVADGGTTFASEGISAVASGGTLVVYPSSDGPHNTDLWAIRRATPTATDWEAPVLLTANSPKPDNNYPAISDDGSRVIFDCGSGRDPIDGEHDLCVVNTDGTGFALVLDETARPEQGRPGEPLSLHQPDFVPNDGIVFESSWGGIDSIWLLPAGAATPIRIGSENNVGPCALPSGHIASLDLARPGNQTGFHELMVSNPDGTARDHIVTDRDVLDAGIGCGA